MEIPQPTLVSLCTDCEAYEAPPEKTCPGCDKRLRPRLVYICPIPDHYCEQQCYTSKTRLQWHMEGKDE